MTKLNKKVATVSSDKVKTYKLLDGNMVSVGSERFCCPEVLSQSSLANKEALRIQDTTFQSIRKSDVDICKDPYANLVFSGGTTTFTNWRAHDQELTAQAPSTMKIKAIAPLERKYSLWIGAQSLHP